MSKVMVLPYRVGKSFKYQGVEFVHGTLFLPDEFDVPAVRMNALVKGRHLTLDPTCTQEDVEKAREYIKNAKAALITPEPENAENEADMPQEGAEQTGPPAQEPATGADEPEGDKEAEQEDEKDGQDDEQDGADEPEGDKEAEQEDAAPAPKKSSRRRN